MGRRQHGNGRDQRGTRSRSYCRSLHSDIHAVSHRRPTPTMTTMVSTANEPE
jgi:hypothetical protein